jgi:hypothetical protein
MFFSEEKNQKTFIPSPAPRSRPNPQAFGPRSWERRRIKSLLLLFFRKEGFACFLMSAAGL